MGLTPGSYSLDVTATVGICGANFVENQVTELRASQLRLKVPLLVSVCVAAEHAR
jgi:hypothetical protein